MGQKKIALLFTIIFLVYLGFLAALYFHETSPTPAAGIAALALATMEILLIIAGIIYATVQHRFKQNMNFAI